MYKRQPIVGSYRALSPYNELDAGVVVVPVEREAVRTLDMVVVSARSAAETETAVLEILNAAGASGLSVESPASLASVQQDVMAGLVRYNKSLLLTVLSAGGLLIAIVALGNVLMQRTDLGRRRAIGASGKFIVSLVVLRTGMAAAIGASAALVAGMLIEALWMNRLETEFILGTCVLAIYTGALAAIPPALVAARQDPLRVIRTP